MHEPKRIDRRALFGSLTSAALFAGCPGLFADELTRTPAQTEGPFYPTQLPLDTDNDLIVLNNGLTPAVGVVTHLSGRILDSRGEPLRNAVVEIWQVDGNGAYLHPGTSNKEKADKHFQGFGRFLTGSTGEYYFRTVKPVAYPGRCPHIHYKIRHANRDILTTQCYVKGDPGNDRDGIYRSLRDPKSREAVTIAFSEVPGSRVGELAARFDIVLGYTPAA